MADIKKYRRELGQHLQKIRKEHHVSQEDLAELIGKSRVQVGYVEQGARTPSLDMLLDVSEALEVPMHSLFDFTWSGERAVVDYDSEDEE